MPSVGSISAVLKKRFLQGEPERVHAAYIYLLKEYSTDLAAFGHTAEACSFIYNKKLSTTLEIIVM